MISKEQHNENEALREQFAQQAIAHQKAIKENWLRDENAREKMQRAMMDKATMKATTIRPDAWKNGGIDQFALYVGVLVVGTIAVLAFYFFCAKMESDTYNRLTGAQTTWWDACWVELRVQDKPKTAE